MQAGPEAREVVVAELAEEEGIGGGLSDVAYRFLAERIERCELEPGSWLNEREASASLGMSRTPFRQALHRLALEGLVVSVGRRGIQITRIDLADIQDNLEVRLALEVPLLRRVVETGLPVDVARLEGLLAQMRAAARTGDPLPFLEADEHYHLTLAEAAANRRALEPLRKAWVHVNRPRYLEPPSKAAMRRSIAQHAAILAAVREGDADAVEQAVRGHIRSAAELFGSLAKRMPWAFEPTE
jgi:DNA-binding GntR family transcriptional regulator